MSQNAWLAETNRRYDLQSIEVMTRCLTGDSVCLDVGAHEGSLLGPMAALAPDGYVFAFEPLPHLAESLRRRFPQVHVHACALSDQTGAATFQHVINDPAYSGLNRRIYDRPDPEVEAIVVWVDRMDNRIPPDLDAAFIKIDVEGAEYHVMRGGIATIQHCRPIIVFEAGLKSTACYGVEPDQISGLLIVECGMMISTMDRWLRGLSSYSRREFRQQYMQGSDYYFIAYPDPTSGLSGSRWDCG